MNDQEDLWGFLPSLNLSCYEKAPVFQCERSGPAESLFIWPLISLHSVFLWPFLLTEAQMLLAHTYLLSSYVVYRPRKMRLLC